MELAEEGGLGYACVSDVDGAELARLAARLGGDPRTDHRRLRRGTAGKRYHRQG